MQAGKEEKCGQVGWWSRQGMQSHREFKGEHSVNHRWLCTREDVCQVCGLRLLFHQSLSLARVISTEIVHTEISNSNRHKDMGVGSPCTGVNMCWQEFPLKTLRLLVKVFRWEAVAAITISFQL